jgi:hypothetical protein
MAGANVISAGRTGMLTASHLSCGRAIRIRQIVTKRNAAACAGATTQEEYHNSTGDGRCTVFFLRLALSPFQNVTYLISTPSRRFRSVDRRSDGTLDYAFE